MKITWYVDVAHNLWLNFRFSLVFSFFVENESNYIQVHKQNWSKKASLVFKSPSGFPTPRTGQIFGPTKMVHLFVLYVYGQK